ncbi:hypothetical protein F5Y18DRAFT_80880 [Xylariaceae sp. FL1019]|nr:hypothetical protein F5Y18DRAFT_80880 [Xylariaceae sp. FL1019]
MCVAVAGRNLVFLQLQGGAADVVHVRAESRPTLAIWRGRNCVKREMVPIRDSSADSSKAVWRLITLTGSCWETEEALRRIYGVALASKSFARGTRNCHVGYTRQAAVHVAVAERYVDRDGVWRTQIIPFSASSACSLLCSSGEIAFGRGGHQTTQATRFVLFQETESVCLEEWNHTLNGGRSEVGLSVHITKRLGYLPSPRASPAVQLIPSTFSQFSADERTASMPENAN